MMQHKTNLSNDVLGRQERLLQDYKRLMEEAYNLRQTEPDLSDFNEFRALDLLNELNKLKFLSLKQHHSPRLMVLK